MTKPKNVAMPPTWFFPTPDPNIFIACDYNELEERYNRNCRKVTRAHMPKGLASEVKRAATVFGRHG